MLIRLINEGDLTDLHKWKNDNKEAFFSQKTISSEQQIKWFTEYQKRPNDFMFMVLVDSVGVGCMGIRIIDNKWDIYNVMVCQEYSRRGLMSTALKDMLHFVSFNRKIPITVEVLKSNSAVDWYKKNSFVVTSERKDCYCLTHQGEGL